jgi:hypothetical protein
MTTMKKAWTSWTSGLVLAALLAAGPVFAQNSTGDVKPTRPDSPSDEVNIITEQGKKIGLPERPRPSSGVTAVRPEVQQPVELKNLIERFQSARQLYLQRQKQLAIQLRQANDEQRAELREQMRDNLDQWREQQLEFRTQMKDRAVELRRELQGELRDVVEEGSKEGGTNRRRE